MLTFIKQHLLKWYPLIILLLLEILLFSINHIPGTTFLGWDNLYPQMNFSENIKRSFFSIWQEYRGLGVVDGMSFGANLFHYIFLWLLSFVLPQSVLRISFIFLMHLVGGVGMYVLIKSKVKSQKSKVIALFGALFYQYNFATIQMFYAPYELFTVHFAFLPILLYTASKYLEERRVGLEDPAPTNRNKTLLWFGIFSLLSTPQAHVPTIFIVYAISLGILMLFEVLQTRSIRAVIPLVVITFLANAFWGLPYLYAAPHSAPVIAESKINQMSTEDIFLRNKAFGDFSNVLLLKGYTVDFQDIQPNGQNDYMMLPWRGHTSGPAWQITGYLFAIVVLIGVMSAIFRGRKSMYPYVVLFLFAFSMLASNTHVAGWVPYILNTYVPYFQQIFRFAFTKFSILYVFGFSLFLAYGLSVIVERLKTIKKASIALFVITALLIVYTSLPAWVGYFFYPNLQITIPTDYNQLVRYLSSQDHDKRVSLLPQPSFWGWTYTDWGYRGSGFIWYGIPQATMDGAFYPWSRENENYYHELSQAVYSRNISGLENVFDKYQISYIVLDGHGTGQFSKTAAYTDELQELFDRSQKFTLVSTFGKIKLYTVALTNEPSYFTFAVNAPTHVAPWYVWSNTDRGFEDNGLYITSKNGGANPTLAQSVYYPFRSLFTGRKQNELEFSLHETDTSYILSTTIPKTLEGSTLSIPASFALPVPSEEKITLDHSVDIMLDGELMQSIDWTNDREASSVLLRYIKKGNLSVIVPKMKTSLSSSFSNPYQLLSLVSCRGKELIKDETRVEGSYLVLVGKNSVSCSLAVDFPSIPNSIGYIFSTESAWKEGKPLSMWLENIRAKKADIEVMLEGRPQTTKSYIIQPPMDTASFGYTLHLDAVSIGQMKTIHEITNLQEDPIPYDLLTQLKIVSGGNGIGKNTTNALRAKHILPSMYSVSIPNTFQLSSSYLVLSQNADSGWKVYKVGDQGFLSILFAPFLGKQLRDKVVVNNWEHGWNIGSSVCSDRPNSCILAIVFLPQYLQFAGFFLLVIFGGYLFYLWRRS